ncbi:MAG: tRNA(Met) cytidine acetyltransferase TmcA domain-containing protein, partial [Candidatus Hodarchaeales archaeon]
MSQGYTQSNQRTLFLFKNEKEAITIFSEFLQYCLEIKHTNPTGLIILDDKISQSIVFQNITHVLSLLRKNVKRIHSSEISTVLGQTVDFLFFDLREDFVPNEVNILLETVRGGGVIFILGLPYSEWIYSINQKRDFIEKRPSSPKRRKSVLFSWFLENIKNNSQCKTKEVSSSEVISCFNPLPYDFNLAAQINNIPVTIEQKKVIKSIVDIFFDSKHPNSCSVLLANRGRGKSASIGLFISQVLLKIGKRSFSATISSPHILNVQTLFDFLSRGLVSENIKFRTIKQEGLISGIHTSSNAKITYIWPSEIQNSLKTDLFVVDEAAAVPVEILKKIAKISARKIFLSTIHGYEGAGRGFQHKFLHYLKKQKQIHYTEYSLDQPIRYIKGDLIEKLLNQTFLLDVELGALNIDSQTLKRASIKFQTF